MTGSVRIRRAGFAALVGLAALTAACSDAKAEGEPKTSTVETTFDNEAEEVTP